MGIQSLDYGRCNKMLRFGMYTPDAKYDVVVREVETELKELNEKRLKYEAEVRSINERKAYFAAEEKKGRRFVPAHGWDKVEAHYDIFRDVMRHMDRIGLYTQEEWATDPKVARLIQSTVKLIPDLPKHVATSLRAYAMEESVGFLPRPITDAVEAFFEENQRAGEQDRTHYTPMAKRHGVKPHSIPEIPEDNAGGVQYHIGNLVGIAGDNHGKLSIHDVNQRNSTASPEQRLVGSLLQTLYAGIQTDQLQSPPPGKAGKSTKSVKPTKHAEWLDQIDALHKTLPSIPTTAIPQVAMNKLREMVNELDAGQVYLKNLTELLMGQLKDVAKILHAGGKDE